MAHTHDVYDTGKKFEINGTSRFIKETSATKTVFVKGDHNSEVITFSMPRYIDGHDMMLCNKIRVHYINIETSTNNKSADIYEVTDLKICEDCENEDVLVFTWTVEAPAAKYYGPLSFLVKFECTEGDEITYEWNTAKYVGINVLDGIDNSEEFVDKYSNVLEEWYNELTKGADSIEELNQQAIAEIELAKEDAKEDIQGKADATMAEMNQFSSNAYNSFKNDVDEKAEETLASIPDDYTTLAEEVSELSSENGIDYKQINSALTQNKTHLKDTSSDGSCYVSNGVVESNNVSGYKKMQIDVSKLPDSGTLIIPFTESGMHDFAIIASEKSDWSNNPLIKQTYSYSTLVNNDHSAASYFHLKWNNNGDGTASLDCTAIKSYIDSRPMLCFFIKNDNNQWFIPYILSSGKKKKLSWLIIDEDNLGEGIDWNIYNGFANIFNKVVCIGDSLTFGQLSGKNSSTQVHSPYPKVLSKLLNTTVDVVAVPGITSKGWYDNKYSSVDFDDYDCAIIWLGTNGGVNYPVGSSATDENTIAYQNIIDGIKSQNPQCKIICIGNVMPFYTRVLKDIAKEKKCVFLDIYHGQLMFDIRRSTADPGSATIYHPSESDWIHFSQIGYIAVANIIYRMLCKSIFENHDYFEFIN